MATQVSLNSGAVASAGALALQTNGTTEAVSISTGQVATFAQNPILTSGTANGVAYLNGSKVLTTGSALVFDGSNLGIANTSMTSFYSGGRQLVVGSGSGSQGMSIYAGSANDSGIYFARGLTGNDPFQGQLVYSHNVDAMRFYTAATERMRLDSAGNWGLGVTPSAWNTTTAVTALQLPNGSLMTYSNAYGFSNLYLSANAYLNSSGNWIYTKTNSASLYQQTDRQHAWLYANSGTAGNAITFTQAMTLDASGNLLVGTTTANSYGGYSTFQLGQQTSGGIINFQGGATSTSSAAHIRLDCSGTTVSSLVIETRNQAGTSSTPIVFKTQETERARIDSSGNLLVGTTSGFSGAKLAVNGSNTDFISAMENTSGTTPAGLRIKYTGVSGGSGGAFLYLHDTNALRCQVAGNGNVTNANNSYGSTSDAKLKENIVDATPKLSSMMQVRVVNYNLIGDTQKQIGVIAQELEQVFPGLVDETADKDEEGNDLGTTTKSVKYSVFVPMLIKAIQEQQAIIESLTARITALEA